MCFPLSAYGKAKYLSTRFLLREKINFNVIILRLYQIYGPYQKFDRLIPFVIKNCLNSNLYAHSHKLSEDVVEDTSVLEVLNLWVGVESADD